MTSTLEEIQAHLKIATQKLECLILLEKQKSQIKDKRRQIQQEQENEASESEEDVSEAEVQEQVATKKPVKQKAQRTHAKVKYTKADLVDEKAFKPVGTTGT